MSVELWTSEAFQDELASWASERAAIAGTRLDGTREMPHARPWSAALVLGSDQGPLWCKVNGPGTAHEPGLVEVLSRRVPGLVPELIAVDQQRGWSLMRDAGPVLRAQGEPEDLWARWPDILRRYAEAQLFLGEHVDELVATGLHDTSPASAPAALRRLVESLAATPQEEGGLSGEDADRLSGLLPSYDAWCDELAASGIPASVNHDDLHSSNVCVGAGGPRIIDWGDAGVSHPFATMLTTLNSIAWHAGVSRDDPQVRRVCDAYLEPFASYGDRTTLRRWVSLARRVGTLGKALGYVNALAGAPRAVQEEMEWPVRGWLLEVLDPEVA